MSFFSQADSTNTEESEISPRPAADAAAVVLPRTKLRFTLLLYDKSSFCHSFSRRSRTGLRA